jgi:hypothetical protein
MGTLLSLPAFRRRFMQEGIKCPVKQASLQLTNAASCI